MVRLPSRKQLRDYASRRGFRLDDAEADDFSELVTSFVDGLDELVDADEPRFAVHETEHTDRKPGYRPDATEDPHNAWILRFELEGAASGPLSGKTIGIKDSIAVAGYEMTLGSDLMRGYVPRIDATVVGRLLDSGATIVGKNNMDNFSDSSSGDTSDFGPVLNPHGEEYLAGGSSSGGAASVAVGDCDIAIGGDQGGSIRTPASWCGVVGLKPTRGLVPYTGVVPVERTTDTVGPLTRSVKEAARTLEAVAGPDGESHSLDGRQSVHVEPDEYTDAVSTTVDGLTVGVLDEGFDREVSDPRIDAEVRKAIDNLKQRGVEVRTVSVDPHRLSLSICPLIVVQGGSGTVDEDGFGTNQTGWYWTDFIRHFRRVTRSDPDRLPPTMKSRALCADYIADEYGLELYAKAKNLILEAERQYTQLLDECDALAMPTTPMLPFEYDENSDRVTRVKRSLTPGANTAPFNHTGHPALTVPCGTVDRLPVGLMLVGSRFDERTLFQLGSAVEATRPVPRS
ncbi:amidase [Salinigranum marinum]|uniref:amidase n=1 Tax=Salinigranum marinum TaxID=1515595 RepID=UPI002989C667|nr:amidase [Salinigranum marinum]